MRRNVSDMKTKYITAILLLAGCATRHDYVINQYETIPFTNHYQICYLTMIRADMDNVRPAPGQGHPRAVVEYSLDGHSYSPFPVVTYGDGQAIQEIWVGNTNIFIRANTTDPSEVGRRFTLNFVGYRRNVTCVPTNGLR